MSKTPVILLTTIPPDVRKRLEADYDLADLSAQKADAPLPGYRVAVTTSMAGVSDAVMARLPDLRFVACNGAGADKLDVAAAAKRGVAIANTPDEVTEDTADSAIALLYATARRTVEADRFVREGQWLKGRMSPSRRILGKKLGIVGLGRIGRAIARRAVGIGMEVSYFGRSRKAGVDYKFEPNLKRLAEDSDALALSCAASDETRHIINGDILKALGPTGILINVARGSVVDEEALIAALKDGTIASAGLDVFESEPNIDPRFLTLPNVVLQPHYASLTHETRAAMVEKISSMVGAFLAGKPVPNIAAEGTRVDA